MECDKNRLFLKNCTNGVKMCNSLGTFAVLRYFCGDFKKEQKILNTYIWFTF